MAENIFSLRKENGVGVVTFDVVGDAMNTWSEAAMAGYRAVLEELEKEKELTGVLFHFRETRKFFRRRRPEDDRRDVRPGICEGGPGYLP